MGIAGHQLACSERHGRYCPPAEMGAVLVNLVGAGRAGVVECAGVVRFYVVESGQIW